MACLAAPRTCARSCHGENLEENRGMPQKGCWHLLKPLLKKQISLRFALQIDDHFELISCLQSLIEEPLPLPERISLEYNAALMKQSIQLMVIWLGSEMDNLLSNPLIAHAEVSVITCCSSQSLL